MNHIEQGMTPIDAMAAMLGDVRQMMGEAGISAPLRFAAALADGKTSTPFAIRATTDPDALRQPL